MTVLAVLSIASVCVNAQTPTTPPPAVVTATPDATAKATPAPSPNAMPATAASRAPVQQPKAAFVLPPEKSQPIVIPKFDKPPVIDGKLDEEVWQKAVVLKDFYQIQPGDNTPPSRPTEVLLGFDPKFLYIAFKATDEPDKVRATVAKRDKFSRTTTSVSISTLSTTSEKHLKPSSIHSEFRATAYSPKDVARISVSTS